MHRTPGLFAGEEVLPVGLAEVFQPAKEVEVIAEIQAGGIIAAGGGVAFKLAAIGGAAVTVQLRVAVGVGNPVLGAGFLHFQRRHPQIAVIYQRGANQAFHLRVDEKGAPAGLLIARCRSNQLVLAERELLRHRRGGALVVRSERQTAG